MSRQALPQNFTINNGQLIEDFEDLNQWVISSGTKAENTAQVKTGSKSLRLNSAGAVNAAATKTVSLNLANSGVMRLWVYLHTEATTLDYVMLFFSSTSNFAKYFNVNFMGLHKGWNLLTVHRDDFINNGADSWNNTMISMRVRVSPITGNTAEATLDSFYTGVEGIPRLMIQFDDADLTAYTEGVAYMNSKGLIGTIYVISDRIDTPGVMTKAQCDDVYSKGWALGNHTKDHVALDTLATPGEIETSIQACTDWLDARGYTRASRHAAYPGGRYTDTSLASMKKLGMLSGRTILPQHIVGAIDDFTLLPLSFNTQNTSTLEQAKAAVDKIIKYGCVGAILFHRLMPPVSSVDWPVANFRNFIDYIVARQVQCITIDEWYNGLQNPRHRSQPLSRTVV